MQEGEAAGGRGAEWRKRESELKIPKKKKVKTKRAERRLILYAIYLCNETTQLVYTHAGAKNKNNKKKNKNR